MKKNKLFTAALSLIVVSSMLAGCISVTTATDNKTSAGTSTSTEVSVSTSADNTPEVSLEVSASKEETDTLTSSEPETEPKKEEETVKEKKVRTQKSWYNYNNDAEDLVLTLDAEYDEYGNAIKYYSVGDCDDMIPYTTTRTEDGDRIIYYYTYDTTGWSEETVEAYKSWNVECNIYDKEGHLIETKYQDGHNDIYEWNSMGKNTLSQYNYTWGTYKYINEYDENGRLLRATNDYGDSVSVVTYKYDENGNCIEMASDGDWGYKTTYTYDDKGNKLTEKYEYNSGSYGSETINEYDENGLLIHTVTKNLITGVITYDTVIVPDSEGRTQIETSIYYDSSTGEEYSRYVVEHTYSTDPRTESYVSHYYDHGVLDEDSTCSSTCVYDDRDQLSHEEYISSWYSYNNSYEYEYDEDGFITKKQTIRDGLVWAVEEYTYFE